MKKIILIVITLCSASLASAFLGFGSKDTSTTGQTQTTSSSGGSFFDRFRKPSAPASPGAPTSQQPSFFDRFRRPSAEQRQGFAQDLRSAATGFKARQELAASGPVAPTSYIPEREKEYKQRQLLAKYIGKKLKPIPRSKKYIPHLARRADDSFTLQEIAGVQTGGLQDIANGLKRQLFYIARSNDRAALDEYVRNVDLYWVDTVLADLQRANLISAYDKRGLASLAKGRY